eukprot:Pgem_evm1s10871
MKDKSPKLVKCNVKKTISEKKRKREEKATGVVLQQPPTTLQSSQQIHVQSHKPTRKGRSLTSLLSPRPSLSLSPSPSPNIQGKNANPSFSFNENDLSTPNNNNTKLMPTKQTLVRSPSWTDLLLSSKKKSKSSENINISIIPKHRPSVTEYLKYDSLDQTSKSSITPNPMKTRRASESSIRTSWKSSVISGESDADVKNIHNGNKENKDCPES